MPRLDKFIGACPLCSTQMERAEHGLVACPEGHYTIEESTFDELWSQWGLLIQRSTILAQQFLEELERNNLIKYLDKGDEK